jgi:hypothetical protein
VSLPPHLLHRVLSLLDRPSLVSAANACAALFDAACAVAPAPRPAAGIEAALGGALCRARAAPPDSSFQAYLPPGGVCDATPLPICA